MLVSIVIPTHNEAQHIGNCLQAIFHLIQNDFEVIVVDNGSIDKTKDIVTAYDCLLVSLDHQTFPAIARNLGVERASGEIIVFLDADVIISELWAEQLSSLIARKNLCLATLYCGAPYHLSRNPGWIEKYWFKPLIGKKSNYINGGNIIISRLAFERLGGFDGSFETGEDVDLAARASSLGIPMQVDLRWKVYHEGFPKSLYQFMRRERWHGKGDYVSLQTFLSSKMALATAFFVFLHLLLIVGCLYEGLASQVMLVSLFLLILMNVLRVFRDHGMVDLRTFLAATFLSYIYFFGRAQSFFFY
ncbi:MAG: glycosyltransferase [Pseudomonadales bacterium]|nr:glycosyltransferase [Pseudomonadales bacterium]